MNFFELISPRDVLEKAKRELARLETELHVDHVFNFFVTAYHIKDYIEKTATVPQATLEAFLKDPDMQACHDLCDKGKHLKLTKNNRVDPGTVIWDSTIGGAPIGVLPIGGGEAWMLFSDAIEVEVRGLANNVIQKWERFFRTQGL